MQIAEPNTIDHQVEGMEMETNESLGDYFIAIISITLKDILCDIIITKLQNYHLLLQLHLNQNNQHNQKK